MEHAVNKVGKKKSIGQWGNLLYVTEVWQKYCFRQITWSLVAQWWRGKLVSGWSTAHAAPNVSSALQKHWPVPSSLQTMYSYPEQRCFWNEYNVAWPCRTEPSSDRTVPTTAVSSVRDLASSYLICTIHGRWTSLQPTYHYNRELKTVIRFHKRARVSNQLLLYHNFHWDLWQNYV